MALKLKYRETPEVLVCKVKRKRKKRKVSATLLPLERLLRRSAQAVDEATSEYVKRHRKSSRKKRDGWLLDAPNNVWRATWKGGKKLQLRKIL